MSSKANLFLGLLWIMISPLCFLTDNTGMGIVWLCAGVVELIIAFIRCIRRSPAAAGAVVNGSSAVTAAAV